MSQSHRVGLGKPRVDHCDALELIYTRNYRHLRGDLTSWDDSDVDVTFTLSPLDLFVRVSTNFTLTISKLTAMLRHWVSCGGEVILAARADLFVRQSSLTAVKPPLYSREKCRGCCDELHCF